MATERLKRFVASARQDDLVIAVSTGGGSAMLVDLESPVTLQDAIEAFRLLNNAGVDMRHINAVRRSYSNVKSGQLLQHIRANDIITIVVSDDVLNRGTDRCTTYVASLLVEKLHRIGVSFVDYPNLVRLNPNVPWKTRGNGALCLRFKCTEEQIEDIRQIAVDIVEENSDLDYEGTEPGMVFFFGKIIFFRNCEDSSDGLSPMKAWIAPSTPAICAPTR